MNRSINNFKNNVKKKSNKLKNHLFSFSLLILLIIILIIIAYYKLKIQITIGPVWDTCDFLANAFEFAGKRFGYSDLGRPPFLSFFVSIFIGLGYVSEVTIYVLDGLLFILGVIGLYLLLKLRFNSLNSFLGSLLFATFPIVLTFVSSGLSDIPSVSFSIWAIYFTVLAVKKNSKFFYLSFPILMLAFLTRYSAALIILPIFLYILINRNYRTNLKDMVFGIFASFLVIVPVLIHFYEKFDDPFYPFISFFSTTKIPVSPENFAYNPEPLYYLMNLPSYIGIAAIAIVLIILGIIVYDVIKLKRRRTVFKKQLWSILKVEKTTRKIKLLIFVILTLLFVGTFGKVFYMLSEVIFFALCYMSYILLKNRDIKNMGINLLFLSWFMVYFIFHSVYVIKDPRYFVTMAPAFSYFLIFGFSEISNRLEFKFKNKNLKLYISLVLIFIMLSSTSFHLTNVTQYNYNIIHTNEDNALASNWLKNHDPQYKNKIIYSTMWPYTAWYLKTNVKMMPIFKDNQTFYNGVKEYTFNPQSSIAMNRELENNNADYFFCEYFICQGLNLPSYKPIKQFRTIVIYEKSNKSK